MGIGSVFAGVALLLVVAAYLARPFRVAKGGAGLDRAIEAWVAQVRAQQHGRKGAAQQEGRAAEEPVVEYCPQCGRRVGPDDRFCARCGTELQEGLE